MDEIKAGLTSNRILDGSPTTTGHGDRAYDDGHGDIRHPADVDFQETAADSLRLSALSPSVTRISNRPVTPTTKAARRKPSGNHCLRS